MLLFLLGTAALLCFIHVLLYYNPLSRAMMRIPGPRGVFLFGNAFDIIVSPTELFSLGRQLAKKFNFGIWRFWVYPIGCVNIYQPEDIEKITSNNKFNEKTEIYKFLKSWLRDGLLLSCGEKWQRRRKILTPAFHFNILRQFCVVLEENTQRLVQHLHDVQGEAVDVIPVISEYTLNSICETAMGTRLREQNKNVANTYKKAISELGDVVVKRLMRVYLIPDLIFNLTTLGYRQRKYLRSLRSFTRSVIEERKEYVDKHAVNIVEADSDDTCMTGKKKTAMLDLLLTAHRDGFIDKDGIQEEVDTFMFEGHDTTAAGLTYCLMLLANHKNIQDMIVSELDSIFGESGRAATIEDLSAMRYLECCIKESLRLYPPVPFIGRMITEPVQLSNYKVPAGVGCHIHIFDIHRNEQLYKDPLKFDPDRFTPENSVRRHPYAYIPFSAGPRNCIGQKFAMLEMKSCISGILRHFELRPVTREADLQFTADMILRNNGPVYVEFITRNMKQTVQSK